MNTTPLDGKRILVVEDDYLVAQVLVELIFSAGATVLGPIGWVEQALAFTRDTRNLFDAAVLDINLHGKDSYPVADVLVERQLGLVFATGYDPGNIDDAYRHHAVCAKPFNREALLAALIPASTR